MALTLFSSSFINNSESIGELLFSLVAENNILPNNKKQGIKATRIAVLSIKKANSVDININAKYMILIVFYSRKYQFNRYFILLH